jgi:hypothetical protein
MSNAFVRAITVSSSLQEKDETVEYRGGIIIYSVNDIQPDEEITVSYGFNIGHPSEDEEYKKYEDNNDVFNWSCECGKSEKDRFLYFRRCYREAKFWWKEDEDHIHSNILLKYNDNR